MADEYSSLDGPLRYLRPRTVVELSKMLNPTRVLTSEDGYLRDWRGLAEFFGCDALTIQRLEKTENPVLALLSINTVKQKTATELFEFLEKMDRYDVIDDTIEMIENDLHMALTQTNADPALDNLPVSTLDDLEQLHQTGSLVEYDAFVLYAPEDQDFVDQVVEKMEGEFGLKLCLKDRDLMAGLPFTHLAIAELISSRCRFVLPIFSKNFLKCEENKFIVNFSELLGIEGKCRKIVPCVYQQCDLPRTISYYTKLDFTRRNQNWDLWRKMRESLSDPATAQQNGKSELRKISTSEDMKSVELASWKPSSNPALLRPVGLPSSPSAPSLLSSANSSFVNSDSTTDSLIKEDPTKSTNWLKKIIKKKSKKKTAEKQKAKAVAC